MKIKPFSASEASFGRAFAFLAGKQGDTIIYDIHLSHGGKFPRAEINSSANERERAAEEYNCVYVCARVNNTFVG